MNFFDGLIDEVKDCLSGLEARACTKKSWQDIGKNELVLLRDTAFELDGIGFNLVTSKPIGDDGVVIYGKELDEITDEKKLFRISIIQIDDIEDEQKAYNLIRKIEYAKYHYFPRGYMVRTASSSHKEAVRVSKSALAQGLSLSGVGNILIDKYRENSSVRAVRVIYINDKSAPFEMLEAVSTRNYDITETLNHIMNNITFDCKSCNLKPICDEVEGMRELHFKNSGM